jgi:hypothetical protein
VSCHFWFDPNILENLTDRTFGTVVDGFTYPESARLPIVIDDPNNPNYQQPHYWGIDGYVKDNCNLELEIRVNILDDCSGDALPGNAPPGAVRLIQRRFIATDPSARWVPAHRIYGWSILIHSISIAQIRMIRQMM